VAAARLTLDELLAEAQTRIVRYSPQDAKAALENGATLIDIRSESNRERDGVVPGSIHIPRTVLEWRVDVDSPYRNPHLGSVDDPIILICDHGCSTILAAATLTELGFTHAGDVIGGFAAWRGEDLPTTSASRSKLGVDSLPGMSGPER
jgi:rhodanese-related sulfurtransferase